MIHDVSTDPETPPQFVALRETRLQCRNGAEYSGLHGAQHRRRHPQIEPRTYPLLTCTVFQDALAAANSLRWQVAAANESEGRIEATATTPLMRFKDDVVIRIRASGNGTHVDIRSASRVGQSDLGTNAKRIQRFFCELENYLKTNT
jgi:uncharacterized protein (DUF1499 family)